VTIDDAIQQCALVAVAKEFVMQCFDKGASRGGKDAKEVPISDFPAYVRTEWRYEQNRRGEQRSLGARPAPKPRSAASLLDRSNEKPIAPAVDWQQDLKKFKEELK
jgi:hypothetical protein